MTFENNCYDNMLKFNICIFTTKEVSTELLIKAIYTAAIHFYDN